MDVTADYLALRRGVGATTILRDVVSASGPDTIAFLQGQLSQDVAALPVGGSAWSLLLEPQGKLDAWVRLGRLADDVVLIDTDGGWGDAVLARLNRFKLRTKCDLVRLAGWRCLALRGPDTPQVDVAAGGAELVADAGWPGLAGVDLLGPAVVVPPGVHVCSGIDAYEAVRIECGVPAMGSELDTGTIPAEAGIVQRSVSWTKGCYTGQELVARIDSRGNNVARRLCGVVLATNVLPPEGAVLELDGAEVGKVTSVAESLDLRAPIALAYLKRGVETPAQVNVRWPGGLAPARVEALPLH